MNNTTVYRQELFEGERALFHKKNIEIYDSVFDNGESPLKEGENIYLNSCLLRWKYPLWYCNHVKVEDSYWYDMARAGVWYSKDVKVSHSVVDAPKNFRRCNDLSLEDVSFPKASETLWSCENVTMNQVTANGDYFAMNCRNMEITNLTLTGNYSFDGVSNVTIRNSRLLSKDAFWNSENVTVYDSYISGEYLGWNARNLTLINCTVESLQGMCYIENLKMVDCKLINTTLAFEYSSVEATITSKIDSVLNPSSGTITAPMIGELIIEKDKVDDTKTIVVCNNISKKSDIVCYK